MAEQPPQTWGTQRRAAARNRAAILDVAAELFAASPAASLNEVAKRAGVGPGTLYRHFPTREALVLAVYQHDVERLVDSVPRLLESQPPLEALRTWITELVRYMRVKHGLGDALSPGGRQSVNEQTYGPVIAAITRLLEAGQRDGSIRRDANAADVLQLTGALWRAPEGEGDNSQRMLGLVLDGLRTQNPTRSSRPRA